MKKVKILFVLLALSFSGIIHAQERVLQSQEIPTEIKKYVKTHFPDNKIMKAIKDKEALELNYDITLDNGTTLEFNRKKQITDIEGKSKLPNSVIPQNVLNYVLKNYPNNQIIKWEIDGINQQIELDNGLELEFSKSGNFLRIDG